MMDANYFKDRLRAQLAGMDGSSTVKLHLHSGLTVLVWQLDEVESGYVLVQAYPLDGSDAELDSNSCDMTLLSGPRLAIPYESISLVEVTRDKSRTLGFKDSCTSQESRV